MTKENRLIYVIVFAAVLISGALVFAGIQFKNGFTGDTFKQNVRKEIDAYVKEQNAAYEAQQKAAQEQQAAAQAQQDLSNAKLDGDFAGTSPVLGDENAPITIVEFSDFQCPYCRSFFNGAYQSIKKNYVDTGKAKIVFRQYPLSFHPDAYMTAMASLCARAQGDDKTFYDFHDRVFVGQSGDGTVRITEDALVGYATDMKLDAKKFKKCIDDGEYADVIKNDQNVANQAGVDGTPAFIINGIFVSGARPYNYFQTVIDYSLDEAKK
ncbi:MAG: DsbA family protein [Candidatus Gracilibacteria bacterium]|jgi:protein-disulfide isomerase